MMRSFVIYSMFPNGTSGGLHVEDRLVTRKANVMTEFTPVVVVVD